MTMHKRRSLFVTGVLLSALVLFGSTAAQAQPADPTSATATTTGYDSIRVTWVAGALTDVTGFEIGYIAHASQTDFTVLDPKTYGKIVLVSGSSREAANLTSLMAATRYVIGVRAVDTTKTAAADRNSMWRHPNPAFAMTDPLDPIGKVEDLELEAGNGLIEAMWDDVKDDIGIHHYKVTTTGPGGFSITQGTGSSDPEFTIMNLTNGVEYTVTVQAIGQNPDGSADMNGDGTPERPGPASDPEKATPMADPGTTDPGTTDPGTTDPGTTDPGTTAGAPEKVEIRTTETTSTNNTINFSWVTPGSGTSALIDYQLEYMEVGRATTFTNNIPPNGQATQSYPIRNLESSTTYEIKLRAQNRNSGYGEWSESFTYATKATPSTPSETGTPGAPQKVVIRVSEATATTTSITFSWVTPGSGLSALIDYQLEYNEVGRSDTFTNNIPPVAGATQEYTITGLKVGAKYQIRLRAQNRSQGYGLWSEYLFKETMAVPGREPSPAVSKVADPMVEAGDKMLMVSWTEPASEKSITHYMLDYKTASATQWMAKPMNVTDMKYTIDGLINGTAYLVRVLAVDSAGNMGEWSDNGSGTPMAGDTDPVPVPAPVPALPIFGAVALGAGLLAAGRARLRRRELRAGRVQRQINR